MSFISGAISGAISSLNTASQGVRLKVDENNVMQAARIVEAEALRFKAKVRSYYGDLRVRAPGGDPVSIEAERVLNAKFTEAEDSYYQRFLDYAAMLHELADQLGKTARTYGFTESQVGDQFSAATHDVEVVRARPAGRLGAMRAE